MPRSTAASAKPSCLSNVNTLLGSLRAVPTQQTFFRSWRPGASYTVTPCTVHRGPCCMHTIAMLAASKQRLQGGQWGFRHHPACPPLETKGCAGTRGASLPYLRIPPACTTSSCCCMQNWRSKIAHVETLPTSHLSMHCRQHHQQFHTEARCQYVEQRRYMQCVYECGQYAIALVACVGMCLMTVQHRAHLHRALLCGDSYHT